MSIEGKTPRDAFYNYLEQLNSLLGKTLTKHPLVPEPESREEENFSFTFGGLGFADIKSDCFGELRLVLGQVCDSIDKKKPYHLRTLKYSYSIWPKKHEHPCIRWDYVKRWPTGNEPFCNHHLQGSGSFKLGVADFSLDEHHLPTGYVPIEDIIRFCIHDLGVKPMGGNWHDTLLESAKVFRKAYRYPPG